MANRNIQINIQIRKLVEDTIHSTDDWEKFVHLGFSDPNLAMQVLGGKFFYTNIVEKFGWKIQQHSGVDFLQNHYRILDPNDVRQAYVLDPQKLIDALVELNKSNK